jgi:hypothetical protein
MANPMASEPIAAGKFMQIVKSPRAALRVCRATIVGFLLLSLAPAGHAQQPKPAAKQVRVLFIGNSLTYVNDLPAELRAIVAAGYPSGTSLRSEQITPGGCTLQKHWNDGKAAAKIASGHWDYVVLQEQSQMPYLDRQQTFHYAGLFDQEIKKAGAKTVLYMTFPLKKKFDEGDPMPDVYTALGKELGAIVVPVDVAWHEAAKLDPNLVLFADDGVHPAPAGTYLAACCFAEALMGKPARPFPSKLRQAGQANKLLADLDGAQARELQKAAATAVPSTAQSAGKEAAQPAVPDATAAPNRP